jgi:hypothetical protein
MIFMNLYVPEWTSGHCNFNSVREGTRLYSRCLELSENGPTPKHHFPQVLSLKVSQLVKHLKSPKNAEINGFY